MKKKIQSLLNESILVKQRLLKSQLRETEKLARMMLATIKSGHKILIFGNGGSAADSIHIAAELVGRFQKERKAVPCIALTSNISTLTAIGNDYGFDFIFERQIQALGKKGDMAIGISTSGKSKNVLRGIQASSKAGLKTAVLTGQNKTRLSEISDVSIRIPSTNTARIQEAHITLAHIICEIIEDAL
ncbi:MAG: SIS domain-containing protein [Candidatus Omnitrophica bacterium]|nr:SIS domain-containing protein [Candidatus Omnitrophota bacterium]MBU4457710.1 SIS domain-containing protein [Candidatus Omnitrophota bacterium]